MRDRNEAIIAFEEKQWVIGECKPILSGLVNERIFRPAKIKGYD